jgi:small subunit ribosomal protein S1
MDQQEVRSGQGEEPESKQLDGEKAEPKAAPETASMETLLEEEGLGLDFPKQGEIRTGVIATIGENEILVSVGTKSEGVLSGRELEQIPDEERDVFEVGLEIPVYVLTPEDSNGNVVLSYSRAREEKDWEKAEELLSSSMNFESKIIGFNKGGLLVPLGLLRGFVPASQVSLVRRAAVTGDTPDQRWGKMVGEEIKVRVIEVDRERRRLILSEKAALQETRETLKDRLLEDLNEGDVRTGRVTSVADFGAFVNIDGADGLVHLSEISWERINHPSEVLKVGQEVDVKVISIDYERKRIGLSIRQLLPDPWLKQVDHLKEGQLIEAKVTHLTKFGAFARLDENLEGLIHVSELSEHRITHPKEVVKEGDVVTLRVIKIDPERRRIGLSLRKVDSAAYSDLDWKMALAEEVVEVQEAKDSGELPEEETPVAMDEPESEPAEETPVEDLAAAEAEDEAPSEEAVAEVEASETGEEEALVEEEIIAEIVEEEEVVEDVLADELEGASQEEEAPVVEEVIAEVEVIEDAPADEPELALQEETPVEEEVTVEVVAEVEVIEDALADEPEQALQEETPAEEDVIVEVVAEVEVIEDAPTDEQEEAVEEDEVVVVELDESETGEEDIELEEAEASDDPLAEEPEVFVPEEDEVKAE